MNIQDWQRSVHSRNCDKGFYEYKDDIRLVQGIVDGTRPVPGTSSHAFTMPEIQYNALCRVLNDYKKAMLERKVLLAIGELCEAHEELRNGHRPDETYFNLVDAGRAPDGSDGGGHKYVNGTKPEGFPTELADTIIRILDICEESGIDAEPAMQLKHDYNGSRPYKHGKSF